MKIVIDSEFKNLIPPLTNEEYKGLEANIIKEGCRDALVLWGDTLIDGHNRYKICTEHNIPFKTIQKDFKNKDEVLLWMIDNQITRRNLSSGNKIILAQRKAPILEKLAKAKQTAAGGDRKSEEYKKTAFVNNDKTDTKTTAPNNSKNNVSKIEYKRPEVIESPKPIHVREEVAKIAGVSNGTVAKFEQVQKKKPELVKAICDREISINEAYNAVKKEERKEQIQKQVEEIEKGNIEKPTGLYDVIAIDPPWNYGTKYSSDGRRVANPYPEMTQEQLKALDIPVKDNAVMFLWTTHKFIWDAKELLDTWGFNYRATLVWDKEKIGMGDLLRMQCEFCLIGIKGKPIFKDEHGIRDIIHEPRREHSRKPDAFYQLVDNLCVGSKLDFFSREHREGWCSYGNDTEKF